MTCGKRPLARAAGERSSCIYFCAASPASPRNTPQASSAAAAEANARAADVAFRATVGTLLHVGGQSMQVLGL